MQSLLILMNKNMFFTPFSQGVKPLRPCEQGIFHRVRTYVKPCEKPCEILQSEKPVKNLLKTYELSQRFSQGRKSQNL